MNATEREQGNILNGSVFVGTAIRVQPEFIYANGLALGKSRLEELDALVGRRFGSLGSCWRGAVKVRRVGLRHRESGHDGLGLHRGFGTSALEPIGHGESSDGWKVAGERRRRERPLP